MPLEIAQTIAGLRHAVTEARRQGRSIGLVPTMGALHEGHAGLMRAARQEAGYVVVSIFVNPLQFGPQEDFGRYPRSWEADLAVCRREGVDLIFAPEMAEVYPAGFRTFVEVPGLQDVLEGTSRPGHFRGVATVVLKLLLMVQPDRAYFGQKDAQQARIIRQMATDLNVPAEIRVCPTVRETDGLALSSRNQYLTPEQRTQATVIYRALETARRLVESGVRDPTKVREAMVTVIHGASTAVLDYTELVDTDKFQPVTLIQGEVLAAVAVKFGQTRLIDNVVLSGSKREERVE